MNIYSKEINIVKINNDYFFPRKINLEEVLLFSENPRFSLNKMSYDLEKISNEIHDEKNDTNNYEKKAIEKLLLNEGDEGKLSNFIKLIESLSKGFNEQLDVIPFLIKNKDFNKYIVIEGNRRFFALKLLYSSNNLYLNTLKNFDFEKYNEEEKNIKKINSDKEKIIKFIENFKNNNNNILIKIPTYEIVVNNKDYEKCDSEIRKIILSRHSHTENSTKKEWPRLKSLAELLIFFSDEYLKELNKKRDKNFLIKNDFIKKIWDIVLENLSFIYNRDETKIKNDIYTSIFVLKILRYDWKNIRNLDLKRYTSKVSSIELSPNNLRSILKEKSLKNFIDLKKTKIENINFEPLNLEIEEVRMFENEEILEFVLNNLYIKNNKKEWKEISIFLLKALEKKWFSTRGYNSIKKTIKNGEIIKKIPIEDSIKHISDFFNEDFEECKKRVKSICIIYSENEEKNVEDIFPEFWKSLYPDKVFNKEEFLNIKDEKIEVKYRKEKNIDKLEYNEKKDYENKINSVFFIKKLLGIKIKELEYKKNKNNQDTYIYDRNDIYSECIFDTWNYFIKEIYYPIINMPLSDLEKGQIFLKGKYRNLFFSFRSIIESILTFESVLNWDKFYRNKPNNFKLTFLRNAYNLGEKEFPKYKSDFEELIFDFEKIKKDKKNGLYKWIQNSKTEINNNNFFNNFKSNELIKILHFLDDERDTLNAYMHNFYFISIKENKYNEKNKLNYKESKLLWRIVDQIKNIYILLKYWCDEYNENYQKRIERNLNFSKKY